MHARVIAPGGMDAHFANNSLARAMAFDTDE